MNTSEKFFDYDLPNDTDLLDPSIASVNDPEEEDEDSELISNMTYRDYLSAVYGYEDKAFLQSQCEKKLLPLEQFRDAKKNELTALEQAANNNRDRRSRLHDDAIEGQKELWQKTQDKLDVLITQEKLRITKDAKDEINKKKNDFLEEHNKFKTKVDELKGDMQRLDNEFEEIKIYRNKVNESSIEIPPIEDESVLDLLLEARDKHWLTAYHKELLQRDADDVCLNRVESFEDLTELEQDFASSQMVADIRQGKVTREVISEFAGRAAIVSGVFFALMGTIGAANPSLVFFVFFQVISSCMFLGGMTLDIVTKALKKKFPAKRTRSKIKIAAVSAGLLVGAMGFPLWAVINSSQGILSFIYTLISSAAAGLFIKQLLLGKIPERILKTLPFLQDRARYYVFKNNLKTEKGKHNLQIYCYLNRNLVINYLTLKHRDDVNADIERRLKENRGKRKKDKSQLMRLAPMQKDLLNKKDEFNSFAQKRTNKLQNDIKQIELRRGDVTAIDFEAKLPQNVSSELIQLDAEYEDIQVQIENMSLSVKRAEEHLNAARKQYEKAVEACNITEEALRYWYKTPTPLATGYKLMDVICFESKKQLSIIHHNLQPFAFRYIITHKNINPSDTVRLMIFKYIRGLIKINPCRMLQINIIDPVSDPKILLNDERFKRLSPMGVINGVHSINDFEIRLFSGERAYNTFKTIFKNQCIEIQKLLSQNHDFIKPFESYSLDLANRIKDNENEPFMYQIMMFIVPRAFDHIGFEPPIEVVRSIENGTYLNMGLLPIFFVDDDSIHDNWKKVIELCSGECIVRKK